MGCDLIPMIPVDEETVAMSYSSFGATRSEIMEAYFLAKGIAIEYDEMDGFASMLGITSGRVNDLMTKTLENMDDEEAPGMLVFLNHCDCEGYYETEDCGMIAKGIEIAMTQMDPEEMNGRVEALHDLFKYAYENNGIVGVW